MGFSHLLLFVTYFNDKQTFEHASLELRQVEGYSQSVFPLFLTKPYNKHADFPATAQRSCPVTKHSVKLLKRHVPESFT